MTPFHLAKPKADATEVLRPIPMTAAEAFADAELAVGYLYRQGEGAVAGYMQTRAYQERAKAALAASPSDEIAALRAERDTYRRAYSQTNDALIASQDEIAAQRERAETAEARKKVLEEALRPFVFGDPTMERILFGHLPDDAKGTITVCNGDFRRARAALSHDRTEVSDG